jgi:hypothetical protein
MANNDIFAAYLPDFNALYGKAANYEANINRLEQLQTLSEDAKIVLAAAQGEIKMRNTLQTAIVGTQATVHRAVAKSQLAMQVDAAKNAAKNANQTGASSDTGTTAAKKVTKPRTKKTTVTSNTNPVTTV